VLAGSKEGLAGLEHHSIVDLKKFIYEEPRAIGRVLRSVTVFENPIPVNVFDRALQPA